MGDCLCNWLRRIFCCAEGEGRKGEERGGKKEKEKKEEEEDKEDGTSTKVEVTVHPQTAHPTQAWQTLKHLHPVLEMKLSTWGSLAGGDGVLRVVCMSDTHGKVEKEGAWCTVPDGDILIHCGDFTMTGQPAEVTAFDRFLGSLPHPVKVVIAGNHELTFDDSVDQHFLLLREQEIRRQLALPPSATQQMVSQRCKALLQHAVYLQDQSVTVCGIRIYGTPWVPKYAQGTMGFTAERGQPLLDKWTHIPDDTDILVTHSPPCGYGDTLERGQMRVGCTELLNTVVRRVKPRLHVFGHIHSGYGMWTNGRTTFINAAICNNSYFPAHAPIVFHIPLPPGYSRQHLHPLSSLYSPGEPQHHSRHCTTF